MFNIVFDFSGFNKAYNKQYNGIGYCSIAIYFWTKNPLFAILSLFVFL